jgi:hypothetical protein
VRWSGGVRSSGQSLINVLSDAGGAPVAILKVPLTASARAEHAAAQPVRTAIGGDARLSDSVRALIPASLWAGDEGGRYAEADRFCAGVPGHLHLGRQPRRKDDLLRRTIVFLTELHRMTRSGHAAVRPAIEERWQYLVGVNAPMPELGRDLVVPRVVAHNDVHPANLLVDAASGALRAVLDWQFAALEGWPALDVLSLLAWTGAILRRRDWHAGFGDLVDALGRPTAPERRLLDAYFAALGLAMRDCLAPLLLLYYLDQRLRVRSYGAEAPAADRNMAAVVRRIVALR